MSRELILGTAGHIDHGKTALVRALTGVDCDRLPEEKARGITIDLGFAPLVLGEFHLGVVDVPGHERFIRNMLAGAAGVDLALLVVAADDSIMPQTREHLEILKLLGLKHGAVALTKCDLVDADTLSVVEMEIRELLRGSFLADAPIIATSATTGQGLAELRSALSEACQLIERERPDVSMPFRLAIDRCFVMQGHGTVVTGSVTSGSVNVGDEIAWLPANGMVRVRSLQNHDQSVEELHRGMRGAINLAGVEHTDVHRGQELAAPGYLIPSQLLTVSLRVPSSTPRPLKHRLPVRLHLGTAEAMAILTLADRETIDAGSEGFGQIVLQEPVAATWGQPFVLRESAATFTIAGGRVLQPVARPIRRRDVDDLAQLPGLASNDANKRAESAVWFRRFHSVTPIDLVREAGLTLLESGRVIRQMTEDNRLVESGPNRLIHVHWRDALELRLLDALAKLHTQHPLMTGHDRAKVESQLESVGEPELVHNTVDRLLAAGRLVSDGGRIARADFTPKLSANQRKLKDKIIELHRSAGFQPPEPDEFLKQAAGNAASVRDLFDVCVAEGHLVRITPEIHLWNETEATLRDKVKLKLAEGRGLTVADIRDLLGTSRKYAVPLCEYLDRIGVTKRQGDLRFPGE